MADAKIINYGQQISAGTTAIPDNTALALDISSTDAKDYIQIKTSDTGEELLLTAGGSGLRISDDGRVKGSASNTFALLPEDGTATNPNLIPRADDLDTGIGWAAADQLSLIAGGAEIIRATSKRGATVNGSAVVKGKASFVLTGSIDVTGTNVNVPGTGTAYLTELAIGDDILVSGETRTIATITNDTTATVTKAWGSDLANDTSPECNPAAFAVIRDTGDLGMVLADDGNVGINAITPDLKLHVAGPGGAADLSAMSNPENFAAVFDNGTDNSASRCVVAISTGASSGAILELMQGVTAGASFFTYGGSGTYLDSKLGHMNIRANTNGKDIIFHDNDGEMMIMKDGGSFGIKVTDPDSNLEVNGPVHIGSGTFSAASANDLLFTRCATTGAATVEFRNESGDAGARMFVKISGTKALLMFQEPGGTNQAQIETLTVGTNGRSMGFYVKADGGAITERLKIGSAGEITITSLPTSDPGAAGQLWNDSATVKVSAG